MNKSVLLKITLGSIVGAAILIAVFNLPFTNAQTVVTESEKRWQRDVEINQLLGIVLSQSYRENEPERATEAINKLGKLKAVEAIPALIEIITFRVQPQGEYRSGFAVFQTRTISRFECYPATQALLDIGEQAVPTLIEVIKKEESESVASINAIVVLNSHFRHKKPQEGIRLLREKASEMSSEVERQRLTKAAEELEKIFERIKAHDKSNSAKTNP